jgi:catechol 2,3-dioxygenase-like lactoylglutathione lyase family enzyme
MEGFISVLSLIVLWPLAASQAQVLAPNDAGVAMGHLYTIVRDMDAAKEFWILMGGTPIKVDGADVIKFSGVFVFLKKGEPSGGTVGTTVAHIGFHVPNGEQFVAKLRAAGVKMDPDAGMSKGDGLNFGYIYSPDNVKIEILNSGKSTAALGMSDVPAASPLTGSIACDHIHFAVPESSVVEIQAWYAKMFGAKPFLDPVHVGPGDPIRAGNLPGVNLKFSKSTDPPVPTKGRALDHIGFEVENLEAFSKKLEASGVKFDQPYSKTRHKDYASVELTDPWGTTIELTEGLNKL